MFNLTKHPFSKAIRDTLLLSCAFTTLIGISSNASASMYVEPEPACMIHPVKIACSQPLWAFTAEFDYLQPLNNDLWIASGTASLVLNGQTITVPHVFYNTPEEPAFKLGLTRDMSSGRDVVGSWQHFRDYDRLYINTSSIATRRYVNNLDIFNLSNKFLFDQINLEFGQTLKLGQFTDLRIHAGLVYLYLEHFLSTYNYLNSATEQYEKMTLLSQFKGGGARIGINANYHLGMDIILVGAFNVATIAGDLVSSRRDDFYDANTLTTVTTNYPNSIERTLVTAFDSRIGINFPLTVCAHTLLLEGGWQWNTYLHAIRHRLSANSGVMQATSNFDFHGPYASIRILL